MTILITGSRGFLGRRAAVAFAELGYRVLTPSHGELDITDRSAVGHWFHQNLPQAVLHCAAVSDTGACQQDPKGTALVNITGSEHLAQACMECGAKLIFCSSDQVYAGAPLPGPHAEKEVLTPGNVYGRQKMLAEQKCLDQLPETVCLRLSWMYDTVFLPAEHGHLLTSLKNTLSDESLSLTWPIHDRRGITDVNAVVKNLEQAIFLPGGVYNFGSENDTDTYHTLQAVFTELGLHCALERLMPNRQAFAHSPRDIRMDGSLAATHGILFPTTADGLISALQKML